MLCILYIMLETHSIFDFSSGVLGFRLEIYLWGILHNTLHRHLDELVERVQLLSHQTLFIEICVNDDPACFLP